MVKPTKPLNAFSLLGLPGLGSEASADSNTESEELSRIPHPLPKYTEAGVLDNPRNFSIAKNSSFAYRIHTMTRNDYTKEDSEKLMEYITTVSASYRIAGNFRGTKISWLSIIESVRGNIFVVTCR